MFISPYVLIMIIHTTSQNAAIHSVEFKSYETCIAARNYIYESKRINRSQGFFVDCFAQDILRKGK